MMTVLILAEAHGMDRAAIMVLVVELARLDPSAARIAGTGEGGGLLPGGRHTQHCPAVRRGTVNKIEASRRFGQIPQVSDGIRVETRAANNIWTFTFAIGFIAWAMYVIGGRPKTAFQTKQRRLVLPLVVTAIILNLYQRGWLHTGAYVSFAFVVYYEFLRPLVKYHKIKGYAQKLQADEEARSVVGTLESRFSVPLLVLALALLLISLGSLAGRHTALRMHKFLVLADRPDFIVPALYADKLIAVRIDREVRRVLPEIILITRKPGESVSLRWEEIGTLSTVSDQDP